MPASDTQAVVWLTEAIRSLPEDPTVFPQGTRLQRIENSGPGWYVSVGPKQVSLSLVVEKDGHRLHEWNHFPKEDLVPEKVKDQMLCLVRKMFNERGNVPHERLVEGANRLANGLGLKWTEFCDRICASADDRSRVVALAERSLRDPMAKALTRVEPFLTEVQWVELVTRVARSLYKEAVVDAVGKL